jgi:hypothetical protein
MSTRSMAPGSFCKSRRYYDNEAPMWNAEQPTRPDKKEQGQCPARFLWNAAPELPDPFIF